MANVSGAQCEMQWSEVESYKALDFWLKQGLLFSSAIIRITSKKITLASRLRIHHGEKGRTEAKLGIFSVILLRDDGGWGGW